MHPFIETQKEYLRSDVPAFRAGDITVVRRGVVRRAKLYYLRDLTGKATRIKERKVRPGESKAAKKA